MQHSTEITKNLVYGREEKCIHILNLFSSKIQNVLK